MVDFDPYVDVRFRWYKLLVLALVLALVLSPQVKTRLYLFNPYINFRNINRRKSDSYRSNSLVLIFSIKLRLKTYLPAFAQRTNL